MCGQPEFQERLAAVCKEGGLPKLSVLRRSMQEAFGRTHSQLATLTAGTGTSESGQTAAMEERKGLLLVSLKVCAIVNG